MIRCNRNGKWAALLLIIINTFSYVRGQQPCVYEWQQVGDPVGSYSGIQYVGTAGSNAALDLVAVTNYNNIYVLKWNGISWVQAGSVVGTAPNCFDFFSLDMDSTGNIIVVSCDDSGDILVYQKQYGNTWVLKQILSISGPLPVVVRVSKDGSTIVAGLRNAVDSNGNKTGKVVVFRKNGNYWQQIGDDIWGEGYDYKFGFSVDVDRDGNTIIVGAPGSFAPFDDTVLNKVFVYQYDNGNWIQKGNVLVKPPRTRFGVSVAINDDGDVIATSAPLEAESGAFSGGIVRIFQFDSINNEWRLKGIPIYNPDNYGASMYYYGSFGRSIDLDASGNFVVIGERLKKNSINSFGKMVTYEFDGQLWIRKGQVLYGEELYFGSMVRISEDANRVFGVAPFSDSVNWGIVYEAKPGRWQIIGTSDTIVDTIWHGYPSHLRISANGKKLIAYLANRTAVYELTGNQLMRVGNILPINNVEAVDINHDGSIALATTSEEVFVFKWDGMQWDVIGYFDFRSSSPARMEAALNEKGDVVAIGVYYGNGNSQVMVYKYYNNSWHLLGDPIYNKGFKVDLDSIGRRLAICGYSPNNEFSIWEWDGLNWYRLGDPIYFSPSLYYASVSISGDGNRVAIGIPNKILNGLQNVGIVYVYEWDVLTRQWQIVGQPLKGYEIWEQFGTDVDLDFHGRRVAVATNANYASKVFEWKDSTWIYIGEPPTGYKGVTITLNGNRVATPVCTEYNEGGRHWYICKIFLYDLTPELPDTINITACSFYVPPSGTFIIDSSGIYYDTINHCIARHPIVIDAIIYSHYLKDTLIIACDSAVLPNGLVVNTSGLYIDSLLTIHGCDSIVRYNVLVYHGTVIDTTIETCDSFISIAGHVWYSSGIYYDTLNLSSGCNPSIRYNVTIRQPSFDIHAVQACDSFISPTGNIWHNSGVFYDTLLNQYGCDSIVEFHLTINQSVFIDTQIVACDSFIMPSGGVVYTDVTFTDNFQTIHGCDSTVVYRVTVVDNDPYIDFSGDTLIAMPQADAYQWFECSNNSFIPLIGDTLRYFVPSQSGYYAVGVIENGCVDTSDCYHIFIMGLDNTSSLFAQVICSDKKLIVKTTTPITDIALTIYDLSGQMILSRNYASGNTFIMNLNQLPAGNYILQLISRQTSFTQKFIKY